ncbi:retron Ec67 family RNA-directed DNA polymerase/endonuclease [Blautia sp.]|uniref:retron Ec67 family RNA-directed DNA polymerase/endonuclease n=1 Tax=Blautia sp. TaxID=1955243 RepID=UPI003AB39504
MKIKFKDIDDVRILAAFLGIEYKELTYVLYSRRVENLYQSFEIPKKNGEIRCINAPQEPLKHVQRLLAKRLMAVQEENYLKSNAIVHGFTRKRGIITNGKSHRNKRFVLNIDLEDFFDSFHFGRVKGYFQKNQFFMLPEEVAACIANIACYNGKLPQGAPSSPVITNLICAILDRRLAAIAKKFRLTYTRYADDLTFSTNSKVFLEKKDELLSEIYAVIEKSGFKVNHYKTRISYRDSRQEVTGLVVNNKISVKREYYKKTRSMLDHLYRGIPVEHNGVELTQQQIEGRLAFINQIDWYNNIQENKKKTHPKELNARERQYQQFLFFKYFFNSEKPTIVTEGKTDIIYVRAALQNLYMRYPKLIRKKEDGSFEYLISFLNRTKRLKFFLGIHQDGANMMKNIYNGFTGKNNFPNLFDSLSKHKLRPRNPIILLFDNETKSNRPLKEFLNYTHKSLETNIVLQLVQNLYLVTIPLVKEKQECEIEDLFDDEVLSHEIDGKTFDRKGNKGNKYYSKQIFASYIAKNMHSIDFKAFIPLLDAINQIITEFKP